MSESSDQSATGSPPPRRPQAPPGAVPDPLLFPVTFHLHKLKAAGDELADVLYWARAGFAAVAVICETLTDLRPVEYLVPLASARDAAAQAADLLDQAPTTPPPPPLRPVQPISVPALGGPEVPVLPGPGSPGAVALAARTQRIADGVVELATAIRGSLRRVAGKATATGDRRAISAAIVRTGVIADGAGPIQDW